MEKINYRYGHMTIPGGGYVTGFCYHPAKSGILYCRTDIGGAYRYDYNASRWISLMDGVTHTKPDEAYVNAIALDPDFPERLYLACGLNARKNPPNGLLAVSEDYGSSFTYHEIPCPVHGNLPGRGTGSRLAVDPNNSDILYFASQRGGLLRSFNRGKDWEFISINTDSRSNERNCTFIWVCPLACADGHSQVLVLGTSGADNVTAAGYGRKHRGHSLYVSYDAGDNWQKLPMPTDDREYDMAICGLVAHRYDYDGKFLYVTLSASDKRNISGLEGYSCDSGDACAGKIIRYPINPDGELGDYEDITPCGTEYGYGKDRINECGFGGICSTPQVPGLLAATTLCENRGDIVFISRDYGDSWEVNLHGLEIGNMTFKTSYMQPQFNGGASLIHWLSDIKINPFDADDVIFNTGTGAFGTYDFTAAESHWSDRCEGIEETVHINVYSPHEGDVIAIDTVGDLGGFAFTATDSECVNSFANENGDRYITCVNADYPDSNPNLVAVTARGNWAGLTMGGVILSEDQCRTFRHIDLPFGLNDYTDRLLKRIAGVNSNSGWVALGAGGQRMVWSLADLIFLPKKSVLVSDNLGQNFEHAHFYGLSGEKITAGHAKVFADRVNPDMFYAFDTTREIYISTDGGHNFYQREVPDYVPEYKLSLIDTADRNSICPEHGKSGTFYIPLGPDGIWRIKYDIDSDSLTYSRITDEGIFYKIGLGIGKDKDYLHGIKSVYAAATIDGIYGFYRSDDECRSWIRINDDKHMFGVIDCICGDARTFGRFYIATGSRGLVYGEECN